MIDRTLIAAVGGVIATLVALVGSWAMIEAYKVVGWQVPVTAGVAVFAALWIIDWLSDRVRTQ